jgi:hypothetical protein
MLRSVVSTPASHTRGTGYKSPRGDVCHGFPQSLQVNVWIAHIMRINGFRRIEPGAGNGRTVSVAQCVCARAVDIIMRFALYVAGSKQIGLF